MLNSIKAIVKLNEIYKRNVLPVIPYQSPKGPRIWYYVNKTDNLNVEYFETGC